MKKIVCEMCEGMDFVKSDGMFVCQECGCKYTVEEARKLMVEVSDDAPEAEEVATAVETETEEFPPHTADSPNRISVTVDKVGHETYTMRSVTSLSALLGEPQPEFVYGPDVVGHIGTAITIQNLAGSAIKYIVVYVTPYNSVGDAVQCTVGGHSTFGMNVTGPLAVGGTWTGYSDGMWYNNSITYAEVAYADVEYMDGTKERFDGADLILQNGANDQLALVNITYNSNAGGAGALWYSIDDGDKQTLMKGSIRSHYLEPGPHVFTVKNPMVKKEFRFEAVGAKTIDVYGKSFGMDISEKKA
jgi:transcription initiation factor TFIIIB Brf1 subunit/transcription initiation factor TFIIB